MVVSGGVGKWVCRNPILPGRCDSILYLLTHMHLFDSYQVSAHQGQNVGEGF